MAAPQNRRVLPMNSLTLSSSGLNSVGAGGFNRTITTPARSNHVRGAAAVPTISPTRRTVTMAYRNASDGVAAALGIGGAHGGYSPTRPQARNRLGGEPLDLYGPASGQQRAMTSQVAYRSAVPSTYDNFNPQFSLPAYSCKVMQAPAHKDIYQQKISLKHGTGSVQGPRPTMEDAHFSIPSGKEIDGAPVALYGILDGHCGRRVADLAAQFLPSDFFAHPDCGKGSSEFPGRKDHPEEAASLGKGSADALVDSIIRCDHKIFHTIQRQDGGSTAIVASVHHRLLTVACLGDARAVLCDGNTAIPMSIDHKPTDAPEQQRIARCGGVVHFGRVGGCLAVSRALGDFEFKFNGNRMVQREFQVSNVPDIRQIEITDSTHYLVLACDGLWDVMTNEEVISWVNAFLQRSEKELSSPSVNRGANAAGIDRGKLLNQCAQQLCDYALARGSMDNVSCTIIAFHEWPVSGAR